MQLSKILDNNNYYKAAVGNVEYALNLQNKLGIYEKNGFDLSNNYYTHTIAYAIRGVLECGIMIITMSGF